MLALLVPVTFQRWSYDAFELPKQYVTLVLTEASLLGAAALWLAQRPWVGSTPSRFTTWLTARPGLAVAAAVAVTWLLAAAASFAPEQSWWGLPPRWAGARAQLAYVALFAAACALTGPGQLFRLAAVTSAAAAVSAGYGLLQRVGRDPFEWGGYLGATVAADLSWRPPGTFGNPNFLAGYLALSLFVTLGALLATHHHVARGAVALSLTLQALALLFTQTRGAWLGTIAGAAVFATAFAALRGRAWRRWLAVAAAILLLLLLALRLAQPLFPPGTLLARAADIVSPTERTAGIRLILWRLVGTAWLSRPLTGFGPDAIAPVFQRAYSQELAAAEAGSQYDRAENAVIDTLLAAGAIGGLAMLATGLLIAWSVVRFVRARALFGVAFGAYPGWLPLAAGATAALAAHLVAQQFNVEVVGASPIAWLLAGSLVGLARAAAGSAAEAGGAAGSAGAPARPAAEAGAGEGAERRGPAPGPALLAYLAAAAIALVLSLTIAWWELRPLRAGVAYEAGLTLQRAGKPAEAVPHLARANALWPHYYLFWAELAYANRAAARAAAGPEKERYYRQALAAVDRALRVNSTHPLVWSYWGDIAAEVAAASNDLTLRNRAKAAHVRATDLAPNWWRYWQNAGDTDMLLGDFPAAKERFARAASLNPGNWILWTSLGDAANRGGDKQTARTAYERALTLNPSDQTAATIRRAIESLGG